jgi:exonuclease VII small subunit
VIYRQKYNSPGLYKTPGSLKRRNGMSTKEETCEQLIESLEDVIESLERGRDECNIEDWDIFSPEDLEEIVELLREMVTKLEQQLSSFEESDSEE